MKLSNAASIKIARDLKSIREEPVEGVFCELVNESNLFEWRIWFEGPGDSPFEGGIFEAVMTFPKDYPMAPPALSIVSEFWHPNVFPSGKVCISILHPPGNDPLSGELPEERWSPTQTVGTIMLSFQSMLSDPNISSPANLDASLEWRDRRQSFIDRVRNLVAKANKTVPPHVKIPHPDTDPKERSSALEKMKTLQQASSFNLDDGSNDSADFGELDSEEMSEGDEDEEDEEEEGDMSSSVEEKELEIVDCPLCKASMLCHKKHLKCATCPTLNKGGKFICGRKCYTLYCGEVLPNGTCNGVLLLQEGWKCRKNTHKDDPKGEENFLNSL